MATLAEKIIAARKRRGMTQADLAYALGLSTSAVSMWEVGKRQPNLTTLSQIADTLNMPVTDFMTDSKDDEWNVDYPVATALRHNHRNRTSEFFSLRSGDIAELAQRLKEYSDDPDKVALKSPEARAIGRGIDALGEEERKRAIEILKVALPNFAEFMEADS